MVPPGWNDRHWRIVGSFIQGDADCLFQVCRARAAKRCRGISRAGEHDSGRRRVAVGAEIDRAVVGQIRSDGQNVARLRPSQVGSECSAGINGDKRAHR